MVMFGIFCKTDWLPECRVVYIFAYPFVRPFNRQYIYSPFNYMLHYIRILKFDSMPSPPKDVTFSSRFRI